MFTSVEAYGKFPSGIPRGRRVHKIIIHNSLTNNAHKTPKIPRLKCVKLPTSNPYFGSFYYVRVLPDLLRFLLIPPWVLRWCGSNILSNIFRIPFAFISIFARYYVIRWILDLSNEMFMSFTASPTHYNENFI